MASPSSTTSGATSTGLFIATWTVGLVERIVRKRAPRQWSLCIHGAPGTGKSQFARHIASRLGMEVMQQRASDLLSCFVGESEKQIAAAFQAARSQHVLLVINEANSSCFETGEMPRGAGN